VKVPLALVADEANVSQEGKLNVLGMFDRITAAEFPVVHPRLCFCFRVLADFADGGRPFHVSVRLEDEDGTVLFDAGGEMVPPVVPPGEFSSTNQVFSMVGLRFERPGTYVFTVRVGDATAEVPFLVQTSAPPGGMN
jgi:hypothetical protein